MMNTRAYLNLSFKWEKTDENDQVLKNLRVLAARDGWSFSQLIREALIEYLKRHDPGNPQLILGHGTTGVKMPETLAHKHVWMVKSGSGARWYECESCGKQVNA